MRQRGIVIWFTGLPCSGKTTLAIHLELALYQRGVLSYLLDGDVLRTGINSNLGFSSEDRLENIRRAAEIAKIMVDCGVVTICSFVSPTNAIRQLARNIVGNEDFREVYVEASIETCEYRDVKGLYARARRGDVRAFTGVSAPFEIPTRPSIVINTEKFMVDDCIKQLVRFLDLES